MATSKASTGPFLDLRLLLLLLINNAKSADSISFSFSGENFKNPPNSGGGYLGLVSPETALDATKNHIVAVEFDSFGGNDWDPNPSVGSNYPHVGININSIKSVKTAGWLIFFKDAGGAKAKARISYDSKTQTLSVLVNYFDTGLIGNTTLSHVIDLRTVLPERVVVGFSATTGDFVETRHSYLVICFN
ncbi:hypothetical protein L6164_020493 [Bauhinia variegata]|uniref:Uncharacterized protein n=1 Tax=Bauhinia variegata TaxID=167791 RepID=A0ACB9MVL4_BAUVA|nr:hypothetical protein L6164_020493 [Bauhinia variegata]